MAAHKLPGYEEAAAQGLVAGINAARTAKGLPHIALRRESSYIGTLLDDLATKVRVCVKGGRWATVTYALHGSPPA